METLYIKSEKIKNNKKKLLKRLKEAILCLKSEYKVHFKKYDFDFNNKALISKTSNLALIWYNDGSNSVGKVSLFIREKIKEREATNEK